ncbi:MAG TPA: hypothetical protein VFT88_11365 [Acidobacteriaceae bacterium]|nr:hypothetical protein [Acidobacteriaceae bacterium]
MKFTSTQLGLTFLGIALLAAPAGFAQQSSVPDQYQGVSHPPLDDEIVATPDTPAPAPEQTVKPKPSPAVPMPPPPPATASETAPAQTVASAPAPAPRYSPTPAAPVVTTGPSDYDSHRWDNTDYGIVTKALPPGDDNPQTPPYATDTTVLHVRSNPAPQASGPSNQLPAGAQIRIRIDQALSTDSTQAGAPFSGRVMLNVMENGSVIIPSGSTMRGRVVQVDQGHHFGPGASLRLRPDVVVLPDGTAYHLDAQVAYSNADGTRVGGEGAVQPSSHVVKKSIEYGATMGTGAIVGAAIAGPPGALAGTIIGAGLVTTHLLLQHPDDASIPAGSDVTFSLTEPLYLIPTRN